MSSREGLTNLPGEGVLDEPGLTTGSPCIIETLSRDEMLDDTD